MVLVSIVVVVVRRVLVTTPVVGNNVEPVGGGGGGGGAPESPGGGANVPAVKELASESGVMTGTAGGWPVPTVVICPWPNVITGGGGAPGGGGAVDPVKTVPEKQRMVV